MLKNYTEDDIFNYDNINTDHQAAALEVVRLVEKFYGAELTDLIKQKFKLVEYKKYDITESPFFKLAEQSGIAVSVHGWVDESGSPVQWPIITMCDDLRKFHNMLGIPNQE